MGEFFSSPIALVALGMAVLAVAIVLLVVWTVTLDRRMRGVVDGLEAERRKVAEMQMAMGRRNPASRGYGSARRAAGAAAPRAQGAPGVGAGVMPGAASSGVRAAAPQQPGAVSGARAAGAQGA
ncbi:MAG: hypothetical protein Q4C41_06470, partial [Eggerthellaceae bacterium]|nr:hypothetical protein [Eggerthellaceae bacterium]